MAYATIADVETLIGRYPVDTTTTPTEAQAATILSGVENEVNSAIGGAGYAVPVAAPSEFVGALKMLVMVGTASALLRSMFPDATDGAEVSAFRFWYDWYTRGLKALMDGSGIPPDVATNSATVYPSTYFTKNPDTEEDFGTLAESLFKDYRNRSF